MQNQSFDVMPAGREMDKLIAEKVMGLDVEPSSNYDGWYGDLIPIGNREFIDPEGWVFNKGKEAVPHYSDSIAAAWRVHRVATQWIFSKRKHYYVALAEIVSRRKNVRDMVIAYPDVFNFVEPQDICNAALAVANASTL